MEKIIKTSVLSLALVALLASPAFAAIDYSCMITAVEKRDNAIIAAWDTFTTAYKTALETRRDALKAAWADTNRNTRKTAIRNAWKTFRNSKKSAWRTRKGAIRSAWNVFKTDRRACGATAADESGTQAIDLNVE